MIQQFGGFDSLLQSSYDQILRDIEAKKQLLTKHFEENKAYTSKMTEIILKVFSERRTKFDFLAVLNPKSWSRKEIIYKSDSNGVVDWKYPADKDLDWNNHLTGVVTNSGNLQFNFLFKKGDTSNAPMTGNIVPAVTLNPPDS